MLGNAWKKANSWYKKTFTMDGADEGPIVDSDLGKDDQKKPE